MNASRLFHFVLTGMLAFGVLAPVSAVDVAQVPIDGTSNAKPNILFATVFS